MRKRNSYSDEFRAGAVLQLEAAGYPNKKGALMRVARNLKISHTTLRHWFLNVHNPPPSKLKRKKRIDLQKAIRRELGNIFDAMDNVREDASYRDLAWAAGVLFDKDQILRGEPTGILKVVSLIKSGELSPDKVRERWPNLADKLMHEAGIDV